MRAASEPRVAGGAYLAFLVAYVVLVEFFDAFATSFRYHMTTYVRQDFHVPLPDMLSALSWVYLGSCLGFLPRLAADIFGRRLMLWVAMTALCVLQFVVGFSRTPGQYVLLLATLAVFYKADIWMLVMTEEAPARHRGLYTALPILIGGAGAITVGELVHRMGDAPDAWRTVARFPIWGVVVAVPFCLGMRETARFRRRRLDVTRTNPLALAFAPFRRGYARPLVVMIGFKTMIGAATAAVIGLIGTEFLRVANGLSPSTVGRLIQLETIAMMAGAFNAGWVSDRIGRLNAARLFCVFYAAALLAMGLVPSGSSAVATLFVVQGHFAAAMMYLLRIVSFETFPNEFRATGSAWTDLVPTVAAIGIAQALGFVTGAGVSLAAVVLGAAVVPLLALPLCSFLPETRAVDLDRLAA
jgi:MFS family permease